MATIFFISLGCDKNRIDAEIMAQRLMDAGHVIVDDAAEAQCAIVNTCGFIDSAKEEAIAAIFEMVAQKQSGQVKAVVVTGCLAQRFEQAVAQEIPEVDAVVGLAHNADIAAVVEQALAGKTAALFGAPEQLQISGKRAVSTPPHYAYIKIAEGCSNRCTYCAIPGIRGHYRSRPVEEIVREAKALAADGVRELIVIAQDTTCYGEDLPQPTNLGALLEALCGIRALWKIRLLYAYPDRITDAFIQTMARHEKIARYIDIPMQHANETVLRRMGRFGDRQQLLEIIGKLRAAMPDITIRSTFIVGFPGETEQQFDELIGFLREAQLDRVGCFTYSPEEGTPAARLPDQIEEAVKEARAQQLMLAQTDILADKLEQMAGRTIEAICDGYDAERGYFACRGESDAPEIDTGIYVPLAYDLMPGELYRVTITHTDALDLYGEIVETGRH